MPPTGAMRMRGSLQAGLTAEMSGGAAHRDTLPHSDRAIAATRAVSPAGLSVAIALLVLLYLFSDGNIIPLNRFATEHHSEYGDLIAAAFYIVAAFALSKLQPFEAALRSHGWSRGPPKVCGWLGLLLPLLLLPLVGGIFNRIRGGWRPIGPAQGWDFMDDHSFSRLLTIGLPNGVLLGTLSGNPWCATHFALFSYLGALPGWGCYFGMAFKDSAEHPDDCVADPDRYGMFDWLVGKAHPPLGAAQAGRHNATEALAAAFAQGGYLDGSPLPAADAAPEPEPPSPEPEPEPLPPNELFAATPWPFWKRYLRDFSGLGLRGLVWLVPPGLGLQAAGHGPLVLLCGACMPLIYSLSWLPEGAKSCGSGFPCFGGGPDLSELLWGIFMWLMFLVALLPGSDLYLK